MRIWQMGEIKKVVFALKEQVRQRLITKIPSHESANKTK